MSTSRHITHIESDAPVRVHVKPKRTNRWYRACRWLHLAIKREVWSQLSPAAQAVIVVLWGHADKRGHAWPSVERLARLSGQSRRSTQRGLAELIEINLLQAVVVSNGRSTNTWRLVEPSGWEIPARSTSTEQNSGREIPGAPGTPGSADSDVRPVTPVAPYPCQPCHPTRVTSGTPPVSPVAPVTDASEQIPANSGEGKDHAAAAGVDLLVRIGFEKRDARKLVEAHGVQAAQTAVSNALFKNSKGELRKGMRPYVVAAMRQGFAPDERIAQDQKKRAAQRERLVGATSTTDRQAEECKLAEEKQRTRDLLRALPAEEFDALRQRVMGRLGLFGRPFEQGSAWDHPALLTLMGAELKKANAEVMR